MTMGGTNNKGDGGWLRWRGGVVFCFLGLTRP
jgi:hypothetical protein